MSKLHPWLLFAALTLSACKPPTPSQGLRVITGKPSAPFQGPVKVYAVGQTYPEPYEEVAIIRFSSGRRTADQLVAGLMNQARQLGANAVIEMRLDFGKKHSSAAGVAVRYGAPAP